MLLPSLLTGLTSSASSLTLDGLHPTRTKDHIYPHTINKWHSRDSYCTKQSLLSDQRGTVAQPACVWMYTLISLSLCIAFHGKAAYLVYMSNKHERGSPAHSSQHEEEAKADNGHVAKEEAALHEA